MSRRFLVLASLACLFVTSDAATPAVIALPSPELRGSVSLEETLAARRSVRAYAPQSLELKQLGQLLWAAQGITAAGRLRTTPSAGALYPLEVYAVVGDVSGLAPGVYRYRPAGHALVHAATGDVRLPLAEAALGQGWIAQAPVVFVISAVYSRTEKKYGERTQRYVHIEVGHAAENLLLEAVALGLGGGEAGAFRDDEVRRVLALPAEQAPLYILPVGKPR